MIPEDQSLVHTHEDSDSKTCLVFETNSLLILDWSILCDDFDLKLNSKKFYRNNLPNSYSKSQKNSNEIETQMIGKLCSLRVYHWPHSVSGLISKSNSEPLEVKLDSDHSVVNAIKLIENKIMNTFVNHVLKCGLTVIADNLPERKSMSRTNYYSVLFDRPTLAVNELLLISVIYT